MPWVIVKFIYIAGFEEGLDKFTDEQGLWGLANMGQILHEEVTEPEAVRGSMATGNVSLCFHCSFPLSMSTDSGTVKHKILEEVDLSLNQIKLIYASEDAHYLLFAYHLLYMKM